MKSSGPSSQNRSHAVMSQRFEGSESLDDFPTPPWATRALMEQIVAPRMLRANMTAWEPACGRGFMSEVLKEYFSNVRSSDVHDYNYGEIRDFLGLANLELLPKQRTKIEKYDWIITNPPFKSAEEFVSKALPLAKVGVAVLVRTVFLESVGRYERLFSKMPPSIVAQFVERVPMVQGRVDKTASTATGYAWLVWLKGHRATPIMTWISPCRKSLERESDYTHPNERGNNVVVFPSQSAPSKTKKLKKSTSQKDLFE